MSSMSDEIIGQRGASSSSLTDEGERRVHYPPTTHFSQVDAADCSSVHKVVLALRKEGFRSSNLIVGVDFTRSNGWNGQNSFSGRSLHAIGYTPNPYEQVISIIGKTLCEFSGPNLIHLYGFGDASTRSKDVFCFYPNERPCYGYTEALERYRELVPHLKLNGEPSFAPIIEMATTVVERSGGQHHVLLIISDGQAAARIDPESGLLTVRDQETFDAIASASNFPLSIVLVGVGDEPWDMMQAFDNTIPPRVFNNFQFVNFSEIMSENTAQTRKEAAFAFAALSKIPQQFKAAMELGILGQISSVSPGRVPLQPPIGTPGASLDRSESFGKTITDTENPLLPSPDLEAVMAASAITTHTWGSQTCAVCLDNCGDWVLFGCGHKVCSNCEPNIGCCCPICRSSITTRIELLWYETLHMATPGSSSSYDIQDVCPICLVNSRDMVFNCGHLTCCNCGVDLTSCLICQSPTPITKRIKLY